MLNLPAGIWQVAVPAGFTLLAVQAVTETMHLLRGERAESPVDDGDGDTGCGNALNVNWPGSCGDVQANEEMPTINNLHPFLKFNSCKRIQFIYRFCSVTGLVIWETV